MSLPFSVSVKGRNCFRGYFARGWKSQIGHVGAPGARVVIRSPTQDKRIGGRDAPGTMSLLLASNTISAAGGLKPGDAVCCNGAAAIDCKPVTPQ